jgi:hypothetical protein
MANGEEVEVKPDDKEKTSEPTKKKSGKGKSAVAKPESDETPEEAADGAEGVSDEEAVRSEAENVSFAAETAPQETAGGAAVAPEVQSTPKSKSPVHLLRFDRRVEKRRR